MLPLEIEAYKMLPLLDATTANQDADGAEVCVQDVPLSFEMYIPPRLPPKR